MKRLVSAQTLLKSVTTDKSQVCEGKSKVLPKQAKLTLQIYFGSSWEWVVEVTIQPLHNLGMGSITQRTGS